jgi:mRNA-degrading endonuclease toxin of MazEF toxin-antitoxin module
MAMSAIGPGRIFWAVYPGERGEGKKRPMITASRRVDINRTGKLIAVVCSTDFTEPLEPTEVLLPSDPEGRCVTQLARETVAVCDWTTEFDASEIQETGGLVPGELMREICRLASLNYPTER